MSVGVLAAVTAPAAAASEDRPSTTSAVAAGSTAPRASLAEAFAPVLASVTPTLHAAPVPVGVRDSVARLWLLAAQAPEPAALTAETEAYAAGSTALEQLAAPRLEALRLAASDPEATVTRLFARVLRRAPRPGELDGWSARLASGTPPAALAVALTDSPEAVTRSGTTAPVAPTGLAVEGVRRAVSDSVLRLQLGLLGRFPTTDELHGAVGRYVRGTSLTTLASELLASPERQARRPAGDTRQEVTALYEDLLGRLPDDAGLSWYEGQLAAGRSLAAVAVAVSQSPESVGRSATAAPEPPPWDLDTPLGPLADGRDVLAVGDSVMLGAAPALQTALPGIRVDAKVSRQFGTGIDILRTLRAAGTLPATVVVHLGTNGDVTDAGCDALLGAAAGRRVVLLTLKVPRGWEAPNNGILRACAERHGATVVDWNAEATGLAGDGYHLGAAGARRYAQLVAGAVAG